MSDIHTNLKAMLDRDTARRQADAERYANLDNDVCQLCGATGEDKRSLWIACFYAVHEVIPEAIDLGAVEDPAVSSRGYHLRICKACRGSLLGHLREWRAERVSRRGLPMDSDGNDDREEDPSRNIPIRENGVIKMLTRAEWDERVAQRDAEDRPLPDAAPRPHGLVLLVCGDLRG